jgi:hypothetical protein
MDDTQKENYRSRNHYGRTYTLLKFENHQLKVENHQQKVEIERMEEHVMKAVNEREDWREKCSKVAIAGYMLGAIIGGLIGFAIRGVL